jgi:hypothetical protein
MRPVGNFPDRALRSEFSIRQRKQMREWCGLKAANAEIHDVLDLLRA